MSYRAYLHLVTSYVFSDRISDLLKCFTLGHMCLCKTDINSVFNSRAIYKFNRVHINESNSTVFDSLSANFKINDCNGNQFDLRQFARRLAEETLSYSSAVMLVALALSYVTITFHIDYKTLSHVYYLHYA